MARAILRPREPKVKLIIDSGAFSAWRLKKTVDLKDYTRFLLTHQHWITQGVALDVIDPQHPENAAKQGWLNYKYMREQGLNPIPVVHIGESFDWIDRYMDAGCDYIGLSASSIASWINADVWYRQAWAHITDSHGRPVIQAHAFGEGRTPALLQFPWKSADTTTWLYSAQRSGTIHLGETNTRRLGFRNDGYATKSSPDIARLEGEDKEMFARLLTKYNVLPDFMDERQSSAAFLVRCFLTAKFYGSVEKRVNDLAPILFRENYGLLLDRSTRPGIDQKSGDFDLYLVVGTNSHALTVAAAAGHNKILASYFYLTRSSYHNVLESYLYNPICTIEKYYPHVYELLKDNLIAS